MSAGERIIDIDVVDEIRDSFLEYSYSVIYSRALPDVRDGLKPVQRRIIYQMGEMGLRPERGHVKSARVTGEVMGKLHPHGDGAIYDALVRLSQPFTLRMPLIDGHGNFGSLDDGPAAARYTEVKLAPAAMLLNQSLDEQVVDFRPNYDAQLTEPEVLPAAFPNLLVNGATGIAVGMATNIPSHNLNEVVTALRLLIADPGCSLDEIMRVLPAPDFPLGGRIVVTEGLRTAYETGRGAVTVRARVQLDSGSAKRPGLLVTELPYLVGPERVIEKIKDLVATKRITFISNIVDLTDRFSGMRLLIELKSGTNAESALEEIYALTPLQENFNVNMVALVDGQPRQLSLPELLLHYLEHRYQVVVRRSRNRLELKQSRLHLLDGLKVAVINLDEVIRIIRQSETVESARQALMTKFELTALQADFILELRLRRLTRFSLLEIAKEANALEADILSLQQLLTSDTAIRTLVGEELEDIAKQFATARRSEICTPDATEWLAATPHLEDVSANMFGLTAEGLIARFAEKQAAQFKTPHNENSGPWIGLTETGEGVRLTQSAIQSGGGDEKFVAICKLIAGDEIFLVTADGKAKRALTPNFKRNRHALIRAPLGAASIGIAAGDLIVITNLGRGIRFSVSELPVQGVASQGVACLKLSDDERVVVALCTDITASTEQVLEFAIASKGPRPQNDYPRTAQIALNSLQQSKRARRGTQLIDLEPDEIIYAARIGESKSPT